MAQSYLHCQTKALPYFPADDEYCEVWKTLAEQAQVNDVCIGIESNTVQMCIVIKADWVNGQWQVIAETPSGKISYSLSIAGRHNVKNSLAAIACALLQKFQLKTSCKGCKHSVLLKVDHFTQQLIAMGDDMLVD